ncbi:MAG TPA: hypothetical protein VF520_11070 [Thermoleophilaceae bacterium]|jgi:hypothetical protein
MNARTHAGHPTIAGRALAAMAGALAAIALLPAAAPAAPSQPTMVQDDPELTRSTPEHRAVRLDELKGIGVDIVKVRIDWRDLAPSPTATSKPSGFNGEDPAEYPEVKWRPYDDVLRAIVARGMTPYVMLGGRAPTWASASDGVTRPDPAEFGRFVKAVGTRYSGGFAGIYFDPMSPLPRIGLWAVWNEPNLANWLKPQYQGSRPVSPHVYRGLLYAARDALQASGHGDDQLLIGELLPSARASQERVKVRPIRFLRELACVDSKYRPLTGSSAKARGCDTFSPLPGTGLAYHPYTLAGGPDVRSSSKDDASIAELSRVTSALDKLSKRGRLAATKMPIWISEFGFQTDPPDPFQSTLSRVPGYMAHSEWLAYRNPRVAAYSQYPLVDDPVGKSGSNRYGGFQSGLRFQDGKAKPGVYAGFERTLFVKLRSSKSVELFGAVRAAAAGQDVVLEQRRGSKGSFRALRTVKTGAQGYFRLVAKISSPTKRQYRFRVGNRASRKATAHR